MIRLIQNSFFGGQLDYEMMGRQDYQRYAKGATKLCNFNILKRGGLDKRRGFDRLFNITEMFPAISASTKIRMIPFAYKKTQGFVLVMTPAKCFVVATNTQTQYKVYNVSDLDGVYNSQEIDELDYQQCGDVLFIAHQNHPPARISHVIDSVGEDGFHYETIDFGEAESGIPEIIDAVVTRISVNNDAASTFVEEYKATAMFDGVETYPCEAYKNEYAPNNASSWHGTAYKMPWTESQKIRLTIKPVARTVDGVREYPDEIRVYKKAFNYFGLVGTVKLSLDNSVVTLEQGTSYVLPNTKYRNSDATEDTNILSVSADVPVRAKNGTAWEFAASGTLPLVAAQTMVDGFARIGIGAVYYNVEDGGDEVTLKYEGYDATSISMTDGTSTWSVDLPASGGDKTQTVEKEEGETDEAFRLRYLDAFNVFADSLTDISTIDIPISGMVGNTLTFTVTGGVLPVNSIKMFASPNIETAYFDDKYITPSTNITPPYFDEDNKFTGVGNYPASVALTQQRLVWASTKNEPARIRMSAIGDFYNYATHEIQLPDDAIDFLLPITRFAKINHICEMRKLLLFNSACEWLVDSASSTSGLTYETIQAFPQSYSGSAERLKPIICNNSLIFCERTKQCVRRFAYDLSNDGFAGRDVSILSNSIFEYNSIIDWTYQQFPHSTLWCVLTDGTMASFEYMEEQEIMAWMTHELGGGGKVRCISTSYAVAPALDEVMDVDAYEVATHEEVFAVVERNGEMWIERMRVKSKPHEDSLYHSLCLDGMRVLNSTNGYQPKADTEQDIVWIPADTTTGLPITRSEALAKISAGVDVYEGYLFEAKYISVFPFLGGNLQGNGQFDIKNICGIGLRLMSAFGGKVKAHGTQEYENIPYYYNDPQNDHRPVFGGGVLKLFDHDTNMMSLPNANTRDGRVELVQGDAYPFSLLSYEIDLEPETGGRAR